MQLCTLPLKWFFRSGRELDFTNWDIGQPNDLGSDGNVRDLCVRVNPENGGKWFDMDCDGFYTIICQFDRSEKLLEKLRKTAERALRESKLAQYA